MVETVRPYAFESPGLLATNACVERPYDRLDDYHAMHKLCRFMWEHSGQPTRWARHVSSYLCLLPGHRHIEASLGAVLFANFLLGS